MKPDWQKLDQVLHAAYMIQFCNEFDRQLKSKLDVGPMIGALDWTAELHRLLEGGTCAGIN
jgi:hypothetical protein